MAERYIEKHKAAKHDFVYALILIYQKMQYTVASWMFYFSMEGKKYEITVTVKEVGSAKGKVTRLKSVENA